MSKGILSMSATLTTPADGYNRLMSESILLATLLRRIEAEHASAQPSLMERAGAAAAQIALGMIDGRALILAGPGNNGGDALVVARHLMAAGHAPVVLMRADPARLPADACAAHAAWHAAGGRSAQDFPQGRFGLVVDGLFGIGLDRPIGGCHAEWIERVNAADIPVLALDTPSGLNALTGRVTGPAVRATHTATFIARKPGLLTGAGPDLCGQLTVCNLGLDISSGDGLTISPTLFRTHLQPRLKNCHKGSFGSVAILGGAPGMAGAALLAGRAALHLGAGRVLIGMLERMAVDSGQPELMLREPSAALAEATVVALGPGLGVSPDALALLEEALASALPLVIDADGLNLLARTPALAARLAVRPAPTLLTPHPAEAGRLLSLPVEEIQGDRRAAALSLAQRFNCYIALKGCGTLISTPAGEWFINTTGNPGLASAGSGDVLTGMIAALLAQGWPALAALLGAVHLHGAAADACVAAGQGPIGLTAGEVSRAARALLNRWIDA